MLQYQYALTCDIVRVIPYACETRLYTFYECRIKDLRTQYARLSIQ